MDEILVITFEEALGFNFKFNHIFSKRDSIYVFQSQLVVGDLYYLSSRDIDRIPEGPPGLAEGGVDYLCLAFLQHFKPDKAAICEVVGF